MEKIKHLQYLIFAAFALLVFSCTVETPQDPFDESVPSEVVFVTPSIPVVDENGPSTRVSVSPTATGYRFPWASTDTVGIFPSAGSQVYFSMADGAGTTYAEFDGGGWSLRQSSVYYSYYPFVGDMYLDSGRIPVDFTGQRQLGTATYDGANFYMASSGTTTSGGVLTFYYDMLNTVFRIDATLPVGTYTRMTMSLDEPLFVKEGYYDLSNPVIVAEHYMKTMEIALENFTVQSANSPVSIYAAQAPVDLRGKTVTIRIYSSDGRCYSYQMTPSRQYEAGNCYHFVCTMTTTPSSFWMDTNVWPEDGNHNPIVSKIPGYSASQSIPYLHWYNKPSSPNGTVALLLGGEDYNDAPNMALLDEWATTLTARGVQCVALMYRTPRGTEHYCLSAWQDAQRAVRIIRNAINGTHTTFPFDANKIGVVGWSAGAHLGLMLATWSTGASYNPVDGYESGSIPCNINWAILDAPAYVTTDSDGILPTREGYGTDVSINSSLFRFDAYTPPMCMLHGQDDPYTPMGSTQIYRRIRKMRNPVYDVTGKPAAEVHLYPGVGHEPKSLDRGIEFLKQMGFLDPLSSEESVLVRYSNDNARGQYIRENVWPNGQIPDYDVTQVVPYLEWHFPANRKSNAIQIVYSGGSYKNSTTDTWDVLSIRRYLNAKGITVVTLRYRYKYENGVYDRPDAAHKHLAAWQDLQRTIRVVRSKAAQYGLDPDRIGIMGASAGGHLTVMGATTSRRPAYAPIDAIDQLSCKVQWGIACCPAYALTDGTDDYYSTTGGNDDSAILVPEFAFDPDTAPMLMIHGDSDPYAAMNSVKIWEKLTTMGIPAEVHTLALRPHSFQSSGYPGTGGYTWPDRVGEFLEQYVY